jgi:hypothetical protein
MIQNLMAAEILLSVTLRLSSSCGEIYTDRMLQSGYYTAAEKRILKMLLCTGEETAEERTGLSHCLQFKPDSNDKMNQK